MSKEEQKNGPTYDIDPSLGRGGDSPPTASVPIVQFLDSQSASVKSGQYKANVFLDTVLDEAFDPPILVNPLYEQCSWIEWPVDKDGNQVFGEQPSFQTTSYKEALEHFPRSPSTNRSTEYFHRVYLMLARPAWSISETRVFKFARTSAAGFERMLQKSASHRFSNGKVAPLLAQWWRIGLEDAKSKKTGIAYKRLTFAIDHIEEKDVDFLENNVSAVLEFDKVGFADGGAVALLPE